MISFKKISGNTRVSADGQEFWVVSFFFAGFGAQSQVLSATSDSRYSYFD